MFSHLEYLNDLLFLSTLLLVLPRFTKKKSYAYKEINRERGNSCPPKVKEAIIFYFFYFLFLLLDIFLNILYFIFYFIFIIIFSYFFLCQPPSHSLLLIVPRLRRAAATPACSLAHILGHSYRVPASST